MLKPLSLTLGVLLLCVFVATFVAGFVVGIVNGLIVVVLKVSSFIATLGVSSILGAVTIIFTSNITPPLGVPIVGGFLPYPATHVHDELHARCLVLDDGTTKLVLVICDLLGIDRHAGRLARRRERHAHLGAGRRVQHPDVARAAVALEAIVGIVLIGLFLNALAYERDSASRG